MGLFSHSKPEKGKNGKPDPVGRKRGGRCNGDCRNCPPHYGYRYGRWYYGHGHTEGCEFGGNSGDGCVRS